ncbi:MAG: phosphotransferase [Candidatus Nanoarchaeia archaeon]
MNVNNVKKTISTLSRIFGEISRYQIINTGWKAGTRHSPLLFTTADGTFVYHPTDRTSNIARYKQKLDEKNRSGIISSPIVGILEGGFVTTFIDGRTLDTLPTIKISAVAQLQATFHQVDNYNLDCWTEKLDRVRTYILQHQLMGKNELPIPQFSAYGLIHGDYSPSNIVKTKQRLVTIDLEHVLEGPIAFDLARPLLRVCHNETEQATYLDQYFQKRPPLSREELRFGKGFFFLIQAYDRHRRGHSREAQISLEQFREVFK